MRRQGFATIVALMLVALVAAALSAIAVALHVEKTRTQSAQTQAALRQLLLAGTTDALARSHSWPESIVATDWSVELPAELPAKEVHLSAKLIPNGEADAIVRMAATIEGRHAEQQIQFHRDEKGWSAKSASLGG